jgi:hypothetical protein
MNMVIVLFLETKEVLYETCLDWRDSERCLCVIKCYKEEAVSGRFISLSMGFFEGFDNRIHYIYKSP